MRINYKGHPQITIEEGDTITLGTNSIKVYSDWISGIRDADEIIELYSDSFDLIDTNHEIDWVGDVLVTKDVLKQYSTKVLNQVIKDIVAQQRDQINEKINSLFNTVSDQLFLTDLPLDVSYDFDLKKVLKFTGMHFDNSILNPYDIIKTILQIHEKCSIKKCLVLTNVAHYLTTKQLKELKEIVQAKGQRLILIEFTEMECQEFYGNSDFYYIDQDFVDWYK